MSGRKQILIHLLIIVIVAVLGVCIVYLSLAIFTKHGQRLKVPSVENMSYTQAIEKLRDAGFRTEIRDSVYNEKVRPGFVIEQYPKPDALAKPGRKIFLYINAVYPKEVIIDDSFGSGTDAMRGLTQRAALDQLQLLGFKNIRVERVLGDSQTIVKILANGRVVKKHEKVPVNAKLVVQVYDGRLTSLRDSLINKERGVEGRYFQSTEYDEETGQYVDPGSYDVPQTQPAAPESSSEDEEPDFVE